MDRERKRILHETVARFMEQHKDRLRHPRFDCVADIKAMPLKGPDVQVVVSD
jgi:hypothetical protein